MLPDLRVQQVLHLKPTTSDSQNPPNQIDAIRRCLQPQNRMRPITTASHPNSTSLCCSCSYPPYLPSKRRAARGDGNPRRRGTWNDRGEGVGQSPSPPLRLLPHANAEASRSFRARALLDFACGGRLRARERERQTPRGGGERRGGKKRNACEPRREIFSSFFLSFFFFPNFVPFAFETLGGKNTGPPVTFTRFFLTRGPTARVGPAVSGREVGGVGD